MNEAQKNLAACYEDLAISRAAADVVIRGVRATCEAYGIDDNVLNALDERARRLVMRALPGLLHLLDVEKCIDDTRAPRPARRSTRSVSRRVKPLS